MAIAWLRASSHWSREPTSFAIRVCLIFATSLMISNCRCAVAISAPEVRRRALSSFSCSMLACNSLSNCCWRPSKMPRCTVASIVCSAGSKAPPTSSASRRSTWRDTLSNRERFATSSASAKVASSVASVSPARTTWPIWTGISRMTEVSSGCTTMFWDVVTTDPVAVTIRSRVPIAAQTIPTTRKAAMA